ncbi:WD40 repeat domain-containing protein [Modestobacter marinus]|uniref:WD40 repeat domain-containing protein n=1 Tax=Modestobacter marinus TaxID=477641 RepID=UPI001C95B7FA|nr:hypothetical protein [Modestobacter marinus]
MLTGHTGVVTGLVLLADPHRLVTAGRDGSLRPWDTGRCRQVLAEGLAAVDDCARSRQGTAVPTGADGGVRVWDLSSGTLRGHLDPDRRWLRCAASADGHRVVATGVDGEVRLWSGEVLGDSRPVAHHDGPVRACALSTDGRLLLTGGDDDVLRLVDLDRDGELTVLSLQGRLVAVALHLREPLLLCGDDGGPSRWPGWTGSGRQVGRAGTRSTGGSSAAWSGSPIPRGGVRAVVIRPGTRQRRPSPGAGCQMSRPADAGRSSEKGESCPSSRCASS